MSFYVANNIRFVVYDMRYKITLWLLYFFLISKFCNASSRHITIASDTSNAQVNESLVKDSIRFTVPFTRMGNLIIIKGKVENVEGNFILDTGCPTLLLNKTYFRDYEQQASETESTGVSGQDAGSVELTIPAFQFGEAIYNRLHAHIASLATIENSKGIKILGLIGMQLLEGFEMLIDYETGNIHFQSAFKKEQPGYSLFSDTTVLNTVPLILTDHRIILSTIYGGKNIKLLLDSGAETAILDSRLPDKVFNKIEITGRSTVIGVGQKKWDVLKGDVPEFSIGSTNLEKFPVLIANLEKTCLSISYGICADGVIGVHNLSAKKIGFNFVQRKMFIWK